MSGKQKAATPTGEPVAKRGRGGGGRGAGRKAGGVNARGVDDPALPAKRQSSLADLLGSTRTDAPKKVESPLVEPLAAVAGPSLAASSPVNEAGPSSAARAVAAEPFQSSQELGEQWHHLCGFGEMELVEQHVETVLLENATFLQRVLASNDELFFGPAKELLLAVSKRLGRSAGVDGIDGMDVDGGSVRRVDGIDGMDVSSDRSGERTQARFPWRRLWKNGGHRVARVATSPPCGGRRGLPSLMFDYFMKVVYIPLKSGMIPLLIIFMQTLIILSGSIPVNYEHNPAARLGPAGAGGKFKLSSAVCSQPACGKSLGRVSCRGRCKPRRRRVARGPAPDTTRPEEARSTQRRTHRVLASPIPPSLSL